MAAIISGAYFTARARVIGGFKTTELYDTCWETSRQINKGDESLILVGDIFKDILVLWRMVDSERDKIPESDPQIVEAYVLKRRYPSMCAGKSIPKDECILEVLISTEPSSKEIYPRQKYAIGIDREQGLDLFFTPLLESNLDKEGSLSG
jgi:hypothetical protein